MDEKKKQAFKHERTKKRTWTAIVYPESAPADWIDTLTQKGISCAISPLHDKDVNPDGEIKKAHYHIVLRYDGPTAGSVVRKLVCDELGQPRPEPVESVRGVYRYLTHKDNPEKYQYDEKDIRCLCGFDISDFADLTAAQKQSIKQELTKFIIEEDITEYADFVERVMKLDNSDHFNIATNNTVYFNAFITSRRFKIARRQEQIPDESIDEVDEAIEDESVDSAEKRFILSTNDETISVIALEGRCYDEATGEEITEKIEKLNEKTRNKESQ